MCPEKRNYKDCINAFLSQNKGIGDNVCTEYCGVQIGNVAESVQLLQEQSEVLQVIPNY
jgi:hypothetical protein